MMVKNNKIIEEKKWVQKKVEIKWQNQLKEWKFKISVQQMIDIMSKPRNFFENSLNQNWKNGNFRRKT